MTVSHQAAGQVGDLTPPVWKLNSPSGFAKFTEQELRLIEMSGSFVAVDVDRVHLADLMNAKPGAIVRCRGNPSEVIAVHILDNGTVGCVAGWISEE